MGIGAATDPGAAPAAGLDMIPGLTPIPDPGITPDPTQGTPLVIVPGTIPGAIPGMFPTLFTGMVPGTIPDTDPGTDPMPGAVPEVELGIPTWGMDTTGAAETAGADTGIRAGDTEADTG